MKGIVTVGVIAAVVLLAACAKKNQGVPVEYDIDAEDIREGVANGWYTCVLTIKDDMPAVILAGRMTNGEYYEGVYSISPDDWKSLKDEGYNVAQ